MRAFLIGLLLGAPALSCQESEHEKKQGPGAIPFVLHGKVSALREAPDFLGAGWTGPKGVVLDDVKDLSGLEAEERKALEPVVKAVVIEKVTAFADFTYYRTPARPSDLPQPVTLRILVFESPEIAAAFWEKKYRATGWEKLYETVKGPGDAAVDSKEIPKRIVRVGNVLLTCHQLEKTGEHIKVLERYLKKLGSEGTKKPAKA